MDPVPSLREVFAALAGGSADPATALAASGHGDLPGDLVAQAIVNYADAAPVEVAEHLSSFVVAHSGVPQGEDAHVIAPDTGDGLALLGAAPPDPADGHTDGHTDGQALLDAGADGEPAGHGEHGEHGGPGDHADLFFGAGEPGTPEAGHGQEAGDAHQDGAGDHVGHEGWIDVTSPSFGPDLEHHTATDDDWTHSHTTDGDGTTPEQLDDHGGDEGLGAGAGA